jgi:nucleoside-diphosphate-sugar epimerase
MENSEKDIWVLVTGGTGFVGIHAILQLLQEMTEELCGGDVDKYREATEAAVTAMPKRLRQLQTI